ncbi:MAG: hypothetical protein KGJ84_14365, partial [Elusimicrobia bacterium]|nr:hypothetical protein [Elusimicrobiota bacterium]
MKRLMSLLLTALLLVPNGAFAQVFTAGAAAESAPGATAGISASVRPLSTAPLALNPSAVSAPALGAAPTTAASVPATEPSALAAAPAALAPAPAAVSAAAPALPALPRAASSGPAPARSEASAAPAGTESLAPREASVLRGAWRTVKALVEPVPDAPDSIADAPLTPEAGKVYHASPADWRDESFYFALLDRFARSGPGRPVGEPKDGSSRHGGNLRGVIEQLDYLKGAGVTTLMISPVTQTLPEAYHGYAPVHMLAVDPHLGTMADMKELVAEAHKRGIRVVLDWVLNHAGPVFEYKDGSKWTNMEGPAKEIGEWTQALKPVELARSENFTRHGVIDNWDDPEQAVNGDFPPNYRHYDSLRPETADLMVHIANWWIKETDIDGFRLDAVRHVPKAFLPVFQKRVRDYAAGLGKKNFLFVGENSTGHDADLMPFLDGGMNSLFNYPALRRDNKALHAAEPTSVLEQSFKAGREALGSAVGRLLRFLDNHDTYRFLRVGEPLEILHNALAYVMLSVGIPIIYAGTEQAMRQGTDRLEPEGPQFPADPFNREDMFADGKFKSESSAGDKFDPTSPTYLFMARVNALRAEHPALRRGEQYPRWSDAGGAGLYAFSRIYEGQEVVVAMNFSTQVQKADMWVDHGITPAGTELVDALDGSYRVTAHKAETTGSKIDVEIPARGVRVFVRA